MVEAASIASQTSMPIASANIVDSFTERDVHVAEGVLQRFGELGLPGAGHRHRAFDEPIEEGLNGLQRLLVDARDDFRGVDEAPDAFPGSILSGL